MVKADIFWVKRKRKVYYLTETTYEKCFLKSFKFFNLKDFLFFEYICKMYILEDIKRNCKKSRFM